MKLSELKQIILKEVKDVLENEFNSVQDSDMFDDLPTVNLYIDDKDGVDKMFVDISAMFHSGGNGKVAILKKNPQLRQEVVLKIQKGVQALFRETIHSLAGEPYGLKENKSTRKK